MIISEHPQGSEGWFQDRAGIPTASEFSKILTSTGKASTQADKYMNQLLAEYCAGGPIDQIEATYWMERGKEIEAEGRDTYSFISGNQVDQANFCFLNERKMVGASPDGFIGENGLYEGKSPKGSVLISYMLSGKLPTTYKPQVQGQLWITGREWCDFCCYHPELKPFILRVNRDEKYISLLADEVDAFIDDMLIKRAKLADMGFVK
jgi:hypothetical protein